MHKRIVFRNMDHSAGMENYANEQLAKIEHFLIENEPTPIYLDLILEPSTVHEHNKVELRVKSPHFDLITGHEFNHGEKFYDVLDRVIDTMYLRLHEENKRIKRDDPKTVGRHDDFKKER